MSTTGTFYHAGKTYKEVKDVDEVFRCSECAGPNPPSAERCQYCGYWFKEPEPVAQIAAEASREQDAYSGYSSPTQSMQAFRTVVYFSIVLLVVSIMGSMFTNNTIQADFTEAAVLAASLLGVILFLGAVRLVNL